jgi:hypothetical protein
MFGVQRDEKKKKKERKKKEYYKYQKKMFGDKGYYRDIKDAVFYEYKPSSKTYEIKNFKDIPGDFVYVKNKLKRFVHDKKKKEKKEKLPFYINLDGGKKAFLIKGSNYKGNKNYLYNKQGVKVSEKDFNPNNNYWVLYDKENKRPKKEKKKKNENNVVKNNNMFSVKPTLKLIRSVLKESNAKLDIKLGNYVTDKLIKGIKNDIISLMLGAKIISKYANHKNLTLRDLLLSHHLMSLSDGYYDFPNSKKIDKNTLKTISNNINAIPHIVRGKI